MQSPMNNPALKSHLETQMNFFTALSNRMVDSVQKVSALNLRLTQQLVEDAIETNRHLVSSGSPVEFASSAATLLQPAGEHLREYQRELISVLAGTQLELTRAAETHIPEAQRSASAMADEAIRMGSEASDQFAEQQRAAMDRMGSAARGNGNGQQTHNPT